AQDKEDAPAEGDAKSTADTKSSKSKSKSTDDDAKTSKEDKIVKKEVKIDFDDMERRMVMLPPEAGNIGTLRAVSGKVIFIRYPNNGSADEKTTLIYYDLDKREEKTIISDINDFEISADGKKLIVSKNGSYYIIDIA